MKGLIILTAALLTLTAAANAQVAQNGNYKLEQSIVSSGGGTSSASPSGGTYTLDGVIGEPVAGTTSGAETFSLKGGFLSSPSFAPTAASVSIGGRVVTADGSGLMNALVTLTDSLGNARTISTRKMGAFRFDDVNAGEVYIITISSRRYTFQPQIISPTENLTGLNFTAQGTVVLF